ncbi:uncharacterized protein LOC131940263 [Physella acuta]|uniref:uncharacterized protein LOC131940263 n=1 Tax=Physella acuta TaxID=109671 RepID=UPI0027DB9319|nr:uncharacterized protein LOC131940263 [Physella acuta]
MVGNAYGSVCTTTCQQAYELVDVSTQTCLENQTWSGAKPVCQPRSCVDPPPVAKGNFTCPNGQRYQDVCSLNCDQGYTAQPPLTITCNINVEWSQTGSCLDTQAPIFPDGCPASFEVEAASLGEPTYVNYTLPKSTDNSNEPVVLLGNPISGSAFDIGTSTVTVTATDRQGNSVNCTFDVIVKTTSCEAPNIDTSGKVLINYNCPNQYVYGASCLLNCTDGNPITGPSSIKCDKLSTGLQWVWPGNIKPYCNAQSCKKLTSPTNGALACDVIGGVGSEICFLLCNINFTYPASAPDQYTCTKGTWKPSDFIPGCTVRRQPGTALTKPDFYYFTQECSSDSSEIKHNFLLLLENVVSDACGADGCTIDTIEVTCGPVVQRRRRRAAKTRMARETEQFQYKIQAVISLGEYKDQNSPSETQTYYKTLVENINSKIVDASDAGKLNIPEIGRFDTFIYGDSVFSCESGTVIVYSTMSCAGCGPGFTYNNSTKKCDPCPQGTYQGQDISYTCTSCPEGTTTRKSMSTSVMDCQNLCLPGHFSSTGIQPCNSCPKGTFASQYGMKQCTLCPYGMSTLSTGAAAITECLTHDIRMNENTSKPAIQIYDDLPNKFTFMLWIADVSNMDTSYLIISLTNSSNQTSASLIIDTISIQIQRQTSSSTSHRKIKKWNHVAVVYSSRNATLFVNGQMMESVNVTSVSDLSKKDIYFQSSSNVKSILVSGIQMTTTAYTESQIKEFSTSCNKQVDNHVLAFKPWESLIMTNSTCNDKDLCTGEPCGAYGTCIAGTDVLTCVCDDPWTGDQCENAPDFCVGHHCENGATCVNQPQNKGYTCSCPIGFTGLLCNAPNDPVNGGWENWSQWSSCSVTCGSGVKSRSRECDSPKPENGGELCQGSKTETQVCDTGCQDCSWGDWTQWTCDVTCGSGTATRSRTIAQVAVNGGLPCQGPKTSSKLCTLSVCPVVGGFGAWGVWSPCSRSCGGGVSTRQRSCDNPAPSLGGKPCDSTHAIQTHPCNNEKCPVCKNPELREGQKEWNCSTDSSGLQTCNIVCLPGLVLMPSTDNIFQCGPTSNYTWSQQTRDNPIGLTPACSDRKIPESVSPVITTTYDIDCNKPPSSVDLESSVNNQLSQQDCVKQGTCTFTVASQSNCKTSRKRSIGVIVMQVSLTPVGYNDTEKTYFGNMSEQEANAQITKLEEIEQTLQNIMKTNATIFTATIDGVKYVGKAQTVETTIVCQSGSGFVRGFCVDCPAGSYSPGNASCLYCDKGFYQDQPKSSNCVACPSGTTTSGRGSYSPNHCTTNPISYADIYPFMIEPTVGDTTTKGQNSDNYVHDDADVPVIVGAVTGSIIFILILAIISFIITKKFGKSLSKTAPEDYTHLNMSTTRKVK